MTCPRMQLRACKGRDQARIRVTLKPVVWYRQPWLSASQLRITNAYISVLLPDFLI